MYIKYVVFAIGFGLQVCVHMSAMQRTSQCVGMMAGMKAVGVATPLVPGRVSLGVAPIRGYNRDYDSVGGNRLAEQVKKLALELQNDSGAARLFARTCKRRCGMLKDNDLRAIVERCDERNMYMQRFEYVQQNDTSQRGSIELDWIEGRLRERDAQLREDQEWLTYDILQSLVEYGKERGDMLSECSRELDIEDYRSMACVGLKGAGATLLLMYFLFGP